MTEKPDELRAITARRENGAEHVGNIHPSHAATLTPCQNRCQHDRAGEPPQEPAAPVHGFPFRLGARPSLARKTSAALIRPRWVKACGKFPSASPVLTSISSAKRSTSFA